MTSINNNSASFIAQTSLNKASEDAVASIYRLSTGNAIYQPSDNLVASIIGRKLETDISGYSAISGNISQASSLLSIAGSSASNILQIVQQQISLANQSLAATDNTYRGLLDMQFQQLTQQIDATVGNTTFNDVQVINGSLYNNASVTTDTSLNLSSGSLTLNALDLTTGKTFTINGVTFTSGTNFTAAATTSATDSITALNNLVTAINNNSDSRLDGASYSVGSAIPSLTITANANGASGNMFSVGSSTDTALFSGWYTPNAAGAAGTYRTLSSNNMYANGLSDLNTSVSGNVSDNILVGLSGAKATGVIDLSTFNPTNASSATNINAISSANFVSGPIGSNYAKVTLTGHGLNTGDQLSSAGLSFDGLVFTANKNYSVNVIDKNTFYLTASSGTATAGGTAIGSSTTLTLPNQLLNINGSTVALSSTPSAANQVQIGTTTAQTVQNLANYLNSSQDANIAVANYSVNTAGTGINITYKANGDAGNNYYISSISTLSASPLIGFSGLSSSKNLQNGAWHGVDTSNVVNNPSFIGRIGGFQGTYNGTPNMIDLSITIGNYTYSAQNVSTAPNPSPQKIAFISGTVNGTNGGVFNLELSSNTSNPSINSNASAQNFANRLDAAFEGLNFLQTRTINSYSPSGQVFSGSSVTGNTDNVSFQLTTDNFNDLEISSLNFQAPSGPGQAGQMSVTINGEVFSNSAIPLGVINNAQTVTLTSQNNANHNISFYNNSGNNQDFSSQQNASSLSTQFQNAFGLNQGKSSLTFQLGINGNKSSELSISLESASSASLYQNNSLSIASQAAASNSLAILEESVNKMNQLMSQIGASQSRLNFASDNISATIQNLQSAKSQLNDTDIAQESTNLAIAQVKIQASISMLTQANNMTRALLKLFD